MVDESADVVRKPDEKIKPLCTHLFYFCRRHPSDGAVTGNAHVKPPSVLNKNLKMAGLLTLITGQGPTFEILHFYFADIEIQLNLILI